MFEKAPFEKIHAVFLIVYIQVFIFYSILDRSFQKQIRIISGKCYTLSSQKDEILIQGVIVVIYKSRSTIDFQK